MGRTGKRKLFIHIGPPKTGSTSIQGMLHRFSPALETLGVHVIATAADRARHCLVPKQGPGGRQPMHTFEGMWRALRKEVRECQAPCMVISQENLTGAVFGGLVRGPFQELARNTGIQVEVIACLRPQWQWLESKWAYAVRNMTVKPPFGEWLEAQLNDGAPDYLRMLEPWRAAFGKVTVIPLEPSRLPYGLLHRFLEVLGVDDARLLAAAQGMQRRNVRASAKQLALLQLLANALHRHGLDGDQRRRAANRLRDRAALFDDDKPFAPLSHEEIEAIGARFRTANAQLARQYGLEAASELFSNPPADHLIRPSMAGWEGYTDAEQQRVTELVRSRLGLTLPEGTFATGAVPFRKVKAKLARSHLRESLWLRAAGSSALDLSNGFRHLRPSVQGLSILRWWRWQAHGIAHWTLHTLRDAQSVAKR